MPKFTKKYQERPLSLSSDAHGEYVGYVPAPKKPTKYKEPVKGEEAPNHDSQ